MQGLLRHKSGRYYARVYAGDKKKWVSLKTTLVEVARARMQTDETVVEIRKARGTFDEVKSDKMTVATAMERLQEVMSQREALGKIKPSTREFWQVVLRSIKKAWPGLEEMDVNRGTAAQCQKWAASFAKQNSPTYTNNALHALRKTFDQALEAGALYRNPASKLERARVRTTKLELPSRAQFHEIVGYVRASGHRTARDAGASVMIFHHQGLFSLDRIAARLFEKEGSTRLLALIPKRNGADFLEATVAVEDGS